MHERGWTQYQLAKESGIPSSTLSNMFKRSTSPTVATLETICDSFGITLSQFFSNGEDSVELSKEQQYMFTKWAALTKEQKEIIFNVIDNMK